MTNPKEIPEEDINRRVAEALGNKYGGLVIAPGGGSQTSLWHHAYIEGEFAPLHNEAQLCRLLMDNWEGIVNLLSLWLDVLEVTDTPSGKWKRWHKNPEFLANKELWILRALVAYKEKKE